MKLLGKAALLGSGWPFLGRRALRWTAPGRFGQHTQSHRRSGAFLGIFNATELAINAAVGGLVMGLHLLTADGAKGRQDLMTVDLLEWPAREIPGLAVGGLDRQTGSTEVVKQFLD